MLEVGKTYVFFIPPSWLLGGTVDKLENGIAYLRDAAYLESIAQNESMIGSVPMCTDPKKGSP